MTAPTRTTAALYLRSSKDRHDVSIEDQRVQLKQLATEQGLTLVAEYVDRDSGKDDDRPGFQQLNADLRARGRPWDTVIALDTSRVARRRRIAIVFEEMECARRGVRVMYRSLIGVDPETEVLLKSVLQGVDEWHSLISRRKARGGMTTNVGRGFRAGGRAPLGYRLAHIDTGAVREGKPVLKSRLELDPATAPAVQTYLRARAAGERRTLAAALAGLDRYKSSLVGIEWNALTYAGTTVWNVNQPREPGGYVGGSKRRPRAEWTVKEGTHEALITQDEAERLLARLEAYSAKHGRRTSGTYLLTGLLHTAAGAPWYGDRLKYYRVAARLIPARDLDASVLDKVAEDLRSPAFVSRVVAQIRASLGREPAAEAAQMARQATAIEAQISRLLDMAVKLDTPGPVHRKIDELERERTRLKREAQALQREALATRAAKTISDDQVLRQLDAMAAEIGDYDPERLKDFLNRILSGVTIDPGSDEFTLHYKLSLPRRGRGELRWRPHEDATLMHAAELTTYARVKRAA